MSIPPSYPPLPIRIRVAGQTDQGRVREHNEDDYRIAYDLDQQSWGHSPEEGVLLATKGALMVVADGMGGAAAGEVASRIAVEEVKSFFNLLQLSEKITRENIYKILEQAFVNVHEALLIETKKNADLSGMGTTLTVAWLISNELYIAWVGDSRAYLYNNNGIEKLLEPTHKYCTENLKILTDDHSLVWERVIQSEGKYSAEDARLAPDSNVILRCLGHDFDFLPPQLIGPVNLKLGDQILLCTDGLNGMVSDIEIDQIFSQAGSRSDLCQKFIKAANNAGGKDNITLIVADIMDSQHTHLSPLYREVNEIRSNNKIDRIKVNSDKGKAKYTWIFVLILSNLLVIFGFLYFYLNKNSVLTSSNPVIKNDESKNLLPPDTTVDRPSAFPVAPRRNAVKQVNSSNDSVRGNNSSDPNFLENLLSNGNPPTSLPTIQTETQKEEKVTPKQPIESKSIPHSKFLKSKVVNYVPSGKCKVKDSNKKLIAQVQRKKDGHKMLYFPRNNKGYFFACNEDEIELDLENYSFSEMTIWYTMTNGQSEEIFIEQIILNAKEWNKLKIQMKSN